MEYTTLGRTGLRISRICLGTLSFGGNRSWTLDVDESRALVERAIDLGVNFFDTSNAYGGGRSEEYLGRVLADYDRERFVVATKGFYQMDPQNRNSGGLSRKAIDVSLDASLDRLGMDAVDLYQIHKWDHETPIETTLRALDDVVRRGKARYIGATSLWAHQFAEALYTSDRLGLERFATMQNHYNLVYREEEREMLPLCAKEGIGVVPWSPLARGYVCRPHADIAATARGKSDDRLETLPYQEGGGPQINERIEELAARHEVSMAQIALAWQFTKVDAPVIGVTKVDHLEDAVAALDVRLSDDDVASLEAPYEPVRVSGIENRPPDRHIEKGEI